MSAADAPAALLTRMAAATMSFLMEVLGEQKNLCRESYREIPAKAVARPPHGKTIRRWSGRWTGRPRSSSRLVSRTRCSVLHDALQSRDPLLRTMGPGSAAHHAAKGAALRSIRGMERRYAVGTLKETARLPGKLVGEDVDLVDGGRLGQQLARFGHQRRGDLAVEVGVAAGLVIERIEYRKGRRAILHREPGDGSRFGLHQRQRRFQELRDLLLLAGLGLKGNVQCKL